MRLIGLVPVILVTVTAAVLAEEQMVAGSERQIESAVVPERGEGEVGESHRSFRGGARPEARRPGPTGLVSRPDAAA